jgi:hypothetical protein
VTEKSLQSDCSRANGHCTFPSFGKRPLRARKSILRENTLILQLCVFGGVLFVAGCGTETPAQKPAAETPAKAAEPVIPEDVQSAADALLGKETKVLLFGDLAKNGKQEFLAANIVAKTPTNDVPGTIVTRAVVVENTDGKWAEVFSCDEHLKNAKGYLGLTPLDPVTGWRLQYEQDPEKGLVLYLTPLKAGGGPHVLAISVRWNSATKRYQSLDRTYEHFLLESPALETPRSVLR